MIATPEAIPVTTPVLLTVATDTELLLHEPPLVALVRFVVRPAHTAIVPVIGSGSGLTVILNVVDEPVQLFALGVTMIVATCVVVPLLVAVNEAMVPVPLAARPMLVLLLVQLYVLPATAPLNDTAVVAAPLHNVWFDTVATVGVGLTVMVNVVDEPVQLFALGVTVMVATCAVVPLLVAVNEAISPVPLAARPMLVLLLVQLYVLPATAPLNDTVVVAAPLHNVWLETEATVGVGLTVMLNVVDEPVQLFAFGVTVMVATCAVVPLLVAVNEAISPVPLAARPMLVLLFDQLYVLPATAPLNDTVAVAAPLQTVWFDTVATVGVGLTVMENVIGEPVQPPIEGVAVMVATWIALPVLIALNEAIFPVPLAASPMLVLLFVQL